jgi:glycosyltransferase involved in cell wall biosynthesis
MKILILNYDLEYGGAERQAVLDANALASRGLDVTFAASFGGPQASLLDPGVGRILLGKIGILPAAWALRKILARWVSAGPVILHAHSGWAEMVSALAKVSGVRVFFNEHGLGLWRKSRHRIALKWCARRAERVFCACEATRRVRVEREGIPGHRTRTLYNALSPAMEALAGEETHEPPAPFTIGFVGRFHPLKRVGAVVDLASVLRDGGAEFRAILVGDGEERPAIQGRIGREGLSSHVECPGYALDPSVYLRRFHVFVLPSVVEGMPLALMEASCAGVPSVAFDTGGNGEVIRDGETGILLQEGDWEGFRAAVRQLMTDEAGRRRMGRAAKRRMLENFTGERRLTALLDAYGVGR